MIPDWFMRLPLNLIFNRATEFKIDPKMVAAIIWVESKGFVYAARYEANYKYTFRVDHFAKYQGITKSTELQLQKTSYGLMQIMGATARWLKYDGALPALYKPENNIYWGCKYLNYLQTQHGEGEALAAAYNAGTPRKTVGGFWENQQYVDKVFRAYRELI